jgi:coenzyme F420-0:L-glutamate ligase/coenzyme F420-1:gamma-L-glutamate ligase
VLGRNANTSVSPEPGEVRLAPVAGMPEVRAGDRLGELIGAGADLREGDVVVVSQKVVSKAEGAIRRLAEVEVSGRARGLAARLGKDPALVQVVLEQSNEVLRAERGVLITETRHGWICANAGVDASNLVEEGTVTLLPADPDASARRIRAEIRAAAGVGPAVVIADSFGRAWRLGQADVAIGCAGLAPLDDWRGRADRSGRRLSATLIAVADEVAAAADLARDKAAGIPVVIARGLERHVREEDGPGAAALRRERDADLFR